MKKKEEEDQGVSDKKSKTCACVVHQTRCIRVHTTKIFLFFFIPNPTLMISLLLFFFECITKKASRNDHHHRTWSA